MERYKLNCILVARYNLCIVTDLKRQREDLWMCRWLLLKYAKDLLALSLSDYDNNIKQRQ